MCTIHGAPQPRPTRPASRRLGAGKYGEWRFDKRSYGTRPPPRNLGEPPKVGGGLSAVAALDQALVLAWAFMEDSNNGLHHTSFDGAAKASQRKGGA